MERPIKEEEEGSDGGQEEALGTAGSGSLAGLDEDPADEGSTGAEGGLAWGRGVVRDGLGMALAQAGSADQVGRLPRRPRLLNRGRLHLAAQTCLTAGSAQPHPPPPPPHPADERRRSAARKPARKPAPRAAARTKAGGAKFAAGAAARPAPSVDTEAGDGSDGEGQKKLGRPLAYKGDPDSPELTDAERRKIKR